MIRLFKEYKGVFSVLLIMFLIMSTFVPFINSTRTAYASLSVGGTYTGPTLTFDGNNDLDFTTTDSAGTSIKYKTVAWFIRLDNTGGDPVKDNNYIKLTICNTGQTPSVSGCAFKQLSETYNASHTRVTSKFQVDASVLDSKLSSNKAFSNLYTGKTMYLSSAFIVEGDPSKAGIEYDTESGIKSAEQWANPSALGQYYDIPVIFKSYQPLEFISQDSAGNAISIKNIPNPARSDGKWPTGPGVTSVSIPDTVTYNGKTEELVCSYQEAIGDSTKVPCNGSATQSDGTVIPKGSDPYYVLDGTGNTVTRHPDVYLNEGTKVVAVYAPVTTSMSLQVSIPGKTNIEGKVTHSVIGKQVPVQVNITTTPTQLERWKIYLQGRSNIQIKLRLWRSDAGVNNTGSSPQWSTTSGPTPATSTSPNVVDTVTSQQLLNILNGTTVPLYQDNLMTYPIPAGGKVGFKYNADFSVTSTLSGVASTISAVQGPSVEIDFYRPNTLDQTIYGSYTSTPQYWSEIKEGSPDLSGTGSNEQFEAMAGTPTDKKLYFSSGGSEFMVDVTVQYVPNATATRTYKSYYTSVVNGWAMAPIVGGWTKDTVPSQPTPRTKTDGCGSSYTETESLQSQQYIKGYTTGKNPSPIYGTEYRWVQNGYNSHLVGGYTDTWTQTVKFDYMRIVKAEVWKLVQSKVNGMTSLLGTNQVTASIVQGSPTIFEHIASSENSAGGRLRYSLETNQNDNVVWDEGSSDNCLVNSKDSGPVNEQKQFTYRRNLTTNVTAVSDVLILQTSSGDQSVLYFQKTSPTMKTTQELDVPKTSFAAMWTNNPLSAAQWSPTAIHIGSYNGDYSNPTNKYSGASPGTQIPTIFDTEPDGVVRPPRPSPYMRLMQTNLQPLNVPNGLYVTGTSTVFYQLILDYNPLNMSIAYNTSTDPTYGAPGQEFMSTYGSGMSKVNNVVIHDPVSVEHAMVVSLPSSMDQRTPASQTIGGNLQSPDPQYQLKLNPNFRQNLVTNGDAEILNPDNTVAGFNTWTTTPSDVTFTSDTGNQWVIDGVNSFEINTAPNPGGTGTNYIGGYYDDIPIKPNIDYEFDGKISCHRCNGYFHLTEYNSDGSVYFTSANAGVTDTTTPTNETIKFKSGPNVTKVRIHILKGNSSASSVSSKRDYLYADDLKLMNTDTQEFVTTKPVYVNESVPNPDYVAAHVSAPQKTVLSYTGSPQTYTVPTTGTYTLKAWGAQGGQYSGYGSTGGKGGYAQGDISLTQGQKLTVLVGGQGSFEGAGGYPDGGSSVGSYDGDSGGGSSSITTPNTSTSSTTLYNWDFSTGQTNNFYTDSVRYVSNGTYNVNLNGGIMPFYTYKEPTVVGHSGDKMYVTLKNDSGAQFFQLVFGVNGYIGYGSATIQIPISTYDTSYKTYTLDLNKYNEWVVGTHSYYSFHFQGGTYGQYAHIKDIQIDSPPPATATLVQAGGGGGSEWDKPNGEPGCGDQACTSVYYVESTGQGGNSTANYASSAGGGGYKGGMNNSGEGPGFGGLGYTGLLSNVTTQNGVQSGNGMVEIDSPGVNIPAQGSPTIVAPVLVAGGTNAIPPDAYVKVPITTNPNAASGGFTPGNFVVADHSFQLYFPNTGDFYGNGAWGIPTTTSEEGKGFTNGMDTTEWTKSKSVRFDFDVLYNNQLFTADTWIPLTVNQTMFDFYVPLSDKERVSALVEWRSEAINAPARDGQEPTNVIRYTNYAARHSTFKRYNVDVVGRIGNMVMEDTQDFRFSNLFKQAVNPRQWFIDNVVPKVDETKQNNILGDQVDIRGNPISSSTSELDTWGLDPVLDKVPLKFPLTPSQNNISALQDQPLRLGYKALMDIQTIGDYYDEIQIIPYYYAMNLSDGTTQPVDVYMNVKGQLEPINKFGAAVPGWDPSTVYSNPVSIDWSSEWQRRNVTQNELTNTQAVVNYSTGTGANTTTGKASMPTGNSYAYGTSQVMYPNGRNRTYIGSTYTYGQNKDPGNALPSVLYSQQAQRWHFSIGLPSSAVVVPKGDAPTQANIDSLRNSHTVLLMTADIKAVGDTYVLQYTNPSGNGNLSIAGTNWSLASIPHPVIAVYSIDKSSADDLSTYGTR